MNKKSILSLTFAALVGVGTVFSNVGFANAKSVSELEQEKSTIQQKKGSVTNDISEKEQQINQLNVEERNLESELAELEKEITDTDSKITKKESEIDETKKEIEKLKAEIKELEDKIEKRTELLKERARNLQENGGSVKYIDVLLGSDSFSDFIDRFTAVSTLVQADQEIMNAQERDKEQLIEVHRQVEENLEKLNNMLAELENLKADLDKKNNEKKAVQKEIKAEKKHVESLKMSLEEEADLLAQQESIINKAIAEEKSRIAEEARIAAEEARKAEEARLANQAPTSNNKTSKSSSNGKSDSSGSTTTLPTTPNVGSGGSGKKLAVWPTSGRLTSGFGPRWGAAHGGIDIANSVGTPIYSADEGVVTVSHFSNSYGNVVYVYHPSKNLTTVYAHMSSRSVSSGQKVTAGQLLGKMGSTGYSTGSHLHFEVHEGSWAHANRRNPYYYY